MSNKDQAPLGAFRHRLHEIIFEADTHSGKFFDVALIVSIILSVVVVMLDSVSTVRLRMGFWLVRLEWFFTVLFTIEYVMRLMAVGRPLKYATSFFGVIDLFAILPTYLSIFFPGTRYLTVIRVLRVLRVFRILKLVQFVGEAQLLLHALKESRRKLIVFMLAVMTLVTIIGSLMYIIEGPKHGFTSIPRGVYWAIVTLTTVGYGDISPQTNLGQMLASVVMILGFSIIAIPTGLVTAQLTKSMNQKVSTRSCQHCSAEGHDLDAVYCKSCGVKL